MIQEPVETADRDERADETFTLSRRGLAGAVAALVAPLAGAAHAATNEKVARRYNPVGGGIDFATADSTHFDPNFPPIHFPHYFMSQGKPVQSFMWIADGPDAKGCVILSPQAYGGDALDSLIPALVGAGINVMRFNPRGMWDNESEYTFPGALDDVHAAIAFLRQNGGRHVVPAGTEYPRPFAIDVDKIAVLGKSGGGGMMSWIAAAENPNLNTIVTVSPQPLLTMPLSPELEKVFADLKASTAGRIDIMAMLRKLTPADYARLDMFKAAPRLANKNVLLIGNADRDYYVKMVHQPLIDSMRNAKNFSQAILGGNGYFLTTRIALTRLVVSWLKNEAGF